MDAVTLCFRGEPLCHFELGKRPLEVGRSPLCDIVVHDPAVGERVLLLSRQQGRVVSYDLTCAKKRRAPRLLPLGRHLPIGPRHSLVRLKSPLRPPRSNSIAPEVSSTQRPFLVVGKGSEARMFKLASRPLQIGSGRDNDIVVLDRHVSDVHCRVEPVAGGVLVRDLDSEEGTWVHGVRIHCAQLREGAVLQIGRTQVTLIIADRNGRGGRTGKGRGGPIARSRALLEVVARAERYARLSWPVLICGETGVGKEAIAEQLHAHSARATGPLVAINAGGLARDLIESELFGHERGAFTGAFTQHRGAFEQAHGGTLFLDEVGELSPELQVRLLRVLETWQVRRIGAEKPRAIDVRIVCATHRDLRERVRQGYFREDLYYRLARLVIEVPPLRERPDDVVPLAEHFLESSVAELGLRELDDSARDVLLEYRWPGNVRELRNVVTLAAAESPSDLISGEAIGAALNQSAMAARLRWKNTETLHDVVARHKGNIAAAARSLGLPRSTLRDRLARTDPRVARERLPK